MKMNNNHHIDNTKYVIEPAMNDTASQNNTVYKNFFLPSSPLAVATAAKHGIVVILNTINAINIEYPMKPFPVIPEAVAAAIVAETPSSSRANLYKLIYESTSTIEFVWTDWANTVNVATTFSFAI